jgi:hypothetical protein
VLSSAFGNCHCYLLSFKPRSGGIRWRQVLLNPQQVPFSVETGGWLQGGGGRPCVTCQAECASMSGKCHVWSSWPSGWKLVAVISLHLSYVSQLNAKKQLRATIVYPPESRRHACTTRRTHWPRAHVRSLYCDTMFLKIAVAKRTLLRLYCFAGKCMHDYLQYRYTEA